MTTHRKINIGPLPEQGEDYSRYEETEVLWGRIALIGLCLAAIVASLLAFVLRTESPAASMLPMVKSSTEVRAEPLTAKNNAPAVSDVQNESLPTANSSSVSNTLSVSNAAQVTKAFETTEASEVSVVPKAIRPAIISPVTSLHEGIIRAELTHSLEDGKPSAPLGYEVAMSEEGIIKVILYTHMQDLHGTILFHDWYRNEERQARVKIPVGVKSQHSHSSKYINTQMIGEWTVKVVDDSGELYAEANFAVN